PVSATADNIERVRDTVLTNGQAAAEEVVILLQITHVSAYEIIRDIFVFRKVCAQWAPRQLPEERKQRCLEICQQPPNPL
ncbi:hypothetical protein GN956_G13956, partial [Arapaima gigas]